MAGETGAADNLVKLWRGKKVQTTFKGHTQAVRALAKLDAGVGDGQLFASAGNDGCASLPPGLECGLLMHGCRTIRLWSLLTGEAVHVLYGHDSFVYSLSAIPDSAGGGLISGGEDRTMRVWRGVQSRSFLSRARLTTFFAAADGECEQTIVIPAISGDPACVP